MIDAKVALITGSSRGIGKSLAIEMLKRSYFVVINGANENNVVKTYRELTTNNISRVDYVVGDISTIEECIKMIDYIVLKYGRLDILVNNAGISVEGRVGYMYTPIIKKVFDVNTLGAIYLTNYALPHIIERKGSIVFISTLAAIHGMPKYSIYSSSKSALTSFCEALRLENSKADLHIGISYVGFTENDPEKYFYKENGVTELVPKRNFKITPRDLLAIKLVRMIEKRKSIIIVSRLGVIIYYIKRFTPHLLHLLMRRFYVNSARH